MSGEQLHTFLDNIEKHMVYIPRLHWDLLQRSHVADLHSSWGRSDRDVLCICRAGIGIISAAN